MSEECRRLPPSPLLSLDVAELLAAESLVDAEVEDEDSDLDEDEDDDEDDDEEDDDGDDDDDAASDSARSQVGRGERQDEAARRRSIPLERASCDSSPRRPRVHTNAALRVRS